MRKKIVRALAVDLFLAMLFLQVLICGERVPTQDLTLKITYGQFHENTGGRIGRLFYAKDGEAFGEENFIAQDMWESDRLVSIHLPKCNIKNTVFRLDPFLNNETFSIERLDIFYGDELLWTLGGFEFRQMLTGLERCELGVGEMDGVYIPLSEDPALYIGTAFNDEVIGIWHDKYSVLRNEPQRVILPGFLFLYFQLGFLMIAAKDGEGSRKKSGRRIAVGAANLIVLIGAALCFGVHYLVRQFGDLRAEELFYHLKAPLDGTNVSTFYIVLLQLLGLAVCVTALVFLVDFILRRRGWQRGYAPWLSGFGLFLAGYALWVGGMHIDITGYYAYTHDKTDLYENYYVDGREVALTFPQEKRNLIYIFLESMEMTYADVAHGGAMSENYMPELTDLALENIHFSGQDVLNGAHAVSGATFTMGAIVAQTAGIPINTTMISMESVNDWKGACNYLLPGAYTLGDVLAQEGYRQVFMIGSDGTFGGRTPYFRGHGNYEVKDYATALEEREIPDGYHVWWGYEDKRLIAYAKKELSSLARTGEPFNFTMLTVDTHFTDGYVCELCEEKFDAQYSNVIACSSRQISAFVDWIARQDFYENTTIIIAGDHPTMDSAYIASKGAEDFDRRVYYTIINPVQGCEEPARMREYTSLDLYPTTLAALGVHIEGDRLGLGVNLFSDIPTLYEEYGPEYLDVELLKNSDLYEKQLLY